MFQLAFNLTWYYDIYFYLFIVTLIYSLLTSFIYNMNIKNKTIKIESLQQQHVAKIDNIRKEHTETLEKIRIEMLMREEERSRQWIESEKETLNVLNGVSILLDLSDKIGRVESEKIINKLDELQSKVEKLTDNEQ